MSNGVPKLLILDGNNLSHRAYWAHKELSYNGRCTGLLFGFFKALVSLHKSYPDYFRVVVWDRGYTRRLEESTKAVEAGIIPMAYKANRRQAEEEMSPDEREAREEIHEQMDEVKSALEFVRCLQVSIEGVEGDDLAYSYARQAQADGGDAVIVSSDLDFMQVLDDHIAVFDAMKQEKWTKERFQIEFCFDPVLWVDKGALEGEEGACLAGHTKVMLLDGTLKTMEELSKIGEFWVYSCRYDGKVEPAKATCRLIKKSSTVVVTLDNGEKITCTPDHRFMLRDGSYQKAEFLVAGNSLMPFYTKRDNRGYLEVFDNEKMKWLKVHSLVAKSIFGKEQEDTQRAVDFQKKLGLQRAWLVVHHKDFNKDNNTPSNLNWMTYRDHNAYHSLLGAERWKDPAYRAKMLPKYRELGSNSFKRAWAEKREVMIANISKIGKRFGGIGFIQYNKSDKHKLIARQNILRYINDPSFAVKRSQVAQKRANAPSAIKRMSILGRATCHRLNKDPLQIERQQTGKVLKIVAEAIKKYGVLNENTYRACHKRGTMTWNTAIKKIGIKRMIGCSNHKVASVESGPQEDVYDLSVDTNSNFAIASGIFVHNSKDNIYGVAGWGPKTACKYVKEFGTVEKIIEAVKAKEKQTKKEQALLNSIPRAMLAKSLKRMDFIPNLPRPRVLRKYDPAELERYFLTFRFASLLKDVWRLV